MARRKNEGRTCPVLNRPLRSSTHRRSGTFAKGAKGRSACRTPVRGRRSDRPPARAKTERKTAKQLPIFHRNRAAAHRKSPCFFGPFGRPRIEGCSVWPNEAKCLSLQFIRSPSAQRERPNLAAHENPHHRSLRFRRFVSRRTRFGARPRVRAAISPIPAFASSSSIWATTTPCAVSSRPTVPPTARSTA